MRFSLLAFFSLLACSGSATAQPRLSDYVRALSQCSLLAGPVARNCVLVIPPDGPINASDSSQAKIILDLLASGQRARASTLADELVTQAPGSLIAHQVRAHVRRALGDLPGALADLNIVIRTGLRDGDPWADRCSVRLRLGDLEGAAGDCDAAAQTVGFMTPAWYGRSVRAGLLLLKGDQAGAERDIQAVLDDNPRHPLALRLRGWLRTLQGNEAARDDVRAAHARRPDVNAEVFELLGIRPPSPSAPQGPNRRGNPSPRAGPG